MLRAMYRPAGRGGTDRPFRISHSPTDRSIKGTETLVAVVDRLRAQGFKIECVMIEGMKHPRALAWKATCDAHFDSFWLGLQGSGLEAGAMGIPVIAGDERTRRLHAEVVGYCPYVFADNASQLEDAIVALIESDTEYALAAARIQKYIRHWHSYEAVAVRYLDVLAERAPELRERIRAAMWTPADGNTVRAMRPNDDYEWLRPPHDPDDALMAALKLRPASQVGMPPRTFAGEMEAVA
jgi:hypothetical protein